MAAGEDESGIAIVGLACRFPGAGNYAQFWRNLATGVESITRLSDEQILRAGVPAAHLENPNYVKAAPILADPAGFDATFFGYTPMEARSMDPQHRILLELAYEALEDAGCDPSRYPGRVGVFTGSAMNTYFMNSGQNRNFAEDYIPTLIVNDKDFLSTRISYKLNLKGPSLTVQTACSTSLVAVHLACQSLLSQESDLALAGAISVRVPHEAGYFCDSGGVVSPDGRVRAFDAAANGTVFGSGGGLVVLKRLTDAIADGDVIHAVIKGSAVNNDGSEKAGYTAPSVNSQADAAVEALANAGMSAEEITYVEAHGSGTPVGDPIEIAALTKAFRSFTARTGYCAIGSVKTNVGHLDAAAGIAGIIKTVLALKHRQLPPSLNYSEANPEIDFPSTPFYVNTRLNPWSSVGPRRAGVVATGMGGTNAHLVLEEAPILERPAGSGQATLLVWSAKSEAALEAATSRLLEHLQNNPALNMEEVAYTLQMGRKYFQHRRTLVCSEQNNAIAALTEKNSRRVSTTTIDPSVRRTIVLLLPGIGDQYVGMAHGLYETGPVFRQEVDRCAEILEKHLGLDIREVIYPKTLDWPKGETKSRGIDLRRMLGKADPSSDDASAGKLNHVLYAQPALFTIEYALARYWRHLGVTPDAMVGHSMGEYVAACLAGVFSLEDALYLIARRTKLVSELPAAAMLAVALSESETIPLLGRDLSISLINGPQLCVVAGPAPAVSALTQLLDEKGVIHRPVQNTHAFHSRMLDPMVSEFEASVREVHFHEPKVPFISNVTGKWITEAEAVDPAYWSRHLNHTARFDDALQTLWQMENAVLLEAGPGKTLGVLAMQHPARPKIGSPVSVSSLRHHYENASDVELLWNSVGKLWSSGLEISWDNLYQSPSRGKVSLPTYPFDRQRHWLEPKAIQISGESAPNALEMVPSGIDEWFYVPSWERTTFPAKPKFEAIEKGSLWLVLANQPGLGVGFQKHLERKGEVAQVIHFGKQFRSLENGSWEISPARLEDYLKLLAEIREKSWSALRIVHLGAVEETEDFDHTQNAGFFSLRCLAQALGELGITIPVAIGIISDQIHEVTGEENLHPRTATLLGPCGVIPKEHANIICFNIDLSGVGTLGNQSEEVITRIVEEFAQPKAGEIVAYRGKHRWRKTYTRVNLPTSEAHNEPGESPKRKRLRNRGVYLITGGTGGIGLVVARYLAENCQARLVLTKKAAWPDKSEWRRLLASESTPKPIIKLIKELLEIESLGSEIEVVAADVSDQAQMAEVIRETLQKFGALNGVIHAAGVIQAGLLQTATREMAEGLLSPKVQGTLVLHELLKDVEMDFFVLFSSMASITNLFAYADYSAANSFLDAFAPYSNAQRKYHTVAINWPVWKEAGMGANLDSYMGIEQWRDEALKRAILNKDGLDAFSRALSSDLAQVIVCPENLEQVLARTSRESLLASSGRRNAPATGRSGRVADLNDVEAVITQIWSEVLGLENIGLHEVFLELGGHSLLAMQIVSRIKATYGIPLTLKDFFQGPTIGQLNLIARERISAKTQAPMNQVEPAHSGTITPLARASRRVQRAFPG